MTKGFEYKNFTSELEILELSVKEFSQLSDTSYNTIMGWSGKEKLPNWVKTWLGLYKDRKEHQQLKGKIDKVKSAINILRGL